MLRAEDHTFVVCAYRENPFLEEMVQSLLRQENLGKILISTSTPNAHIDGVAQRFDLPAVVNPAPRLAGDDWNYGYDSADTPLVTIAHQDDIYEPNYLRSILDSANRYINSTDKPIMLFTDYYELRDNQRVEDNALLAIKRFMNAPLNRDLLNGSVFVKKRILAFGNPICCPAVTYDKSILGDSIFDTTYKNSCDYKTFVDLACRSGRFVYIPEKLVGHRIYAESSTSRNLAENIRKREDLEILRMLWPSPIARAINTAYALSEKSNSTSN